VSSLWLIGLLVSMSYNLSGSLLEELVNKKLFTSEFGCYFLLLPKIKSDLKGEMLVFAFD
jgi:hypothetical protein